MTSSVLPRAALRLFGGFVLEVAGRATAPAPTEQRLLVALALAPGPLARREVASLVWPDAAPGSAGPRLQAAIQRIRRIDDALITRGDLLELGDLDVDVRRFVAWAAGVLAGTIEPAPADPVAQAAASPLLPGWPSGWIALHRERLHVLRLQALEHLAGRLVAAGRPAEAIDAAASAVDAAPLRESARRARVRALAAAGRLDAVQAEYEDYRQALAATLDIEPSEHLQKVMAALGCPPSSPAGDAPVTRAG